MDPYLATIFIIGLVATALLWPRRYDPAMWIKERQEPASERDPGLDALRQGKCPDCGSTALLSGPSGGMSQNIACDECYMEFNIHAGFGTGPFAFDRTGKMSDGRARIFGITPEEYREKEAGR